VRPGVASIGGTLNPSTCFMSLCFEGSEE
jgi:hypothetical protein